MTLRLSHAITTLTKGALLAVALFAVLPARGFASTASARSCAEFAPWYQAKQAIRQAEHPLLVQIIKLDQTEWNARVRSAETIFNEYMSGDLNPKLLDRCLAGQDDRGNFLDTLQSVFYQESVARLRTTRSPAIRRFLALLDQRTQSGSAPLFRLVGEFGTHRPGPWQAGFHRAVRSIYADFEQIPQDQWLLIFTHEILHSLDGELSKSLDVYGDPQTIARIAQWSKEGKTWGSLDPSDRETLRAWIEAGLSRGLWAEYRAWVPSFVIYQEGLQEGLWPRIGWMEAILNSRPQSESLKRFIYLYLDEWSPDPQSGIFLNPLVREALQRVRLSYREGEALPPLGELGKLTE